MALEVGIVGLPNAGKSMLFEALTGARASGEVGMAAIPDPRLQQLAAVVQARKVTPAAVRVVEVRGTGPALLGNLRQVDALLVVLDGFSGTRVPDDDLETLKLELLVADRDHVERRLERVAKQAKSGDSSLRKEAEALEKLLAHLDAGKTMPDYADELPPELEPLTSKPLIAITNGGGGIDLKLEAELAELSEDEAAEFRSGGESALGEVVRRLAETLDLITFFTAGEKETRLDAPAGRDGVRRGGDDPLRHCARLHPLRGDPLGRPRRRRLARRGLARGQAAARGQDVRRRGRGCAQHPLQHLRNSPVCGRGGVRPRPGRGEMKRRFALVLAGAAVAFLVGAARSHADAASCLAHHPQYIEGVIEVQYASGCTGHDEPELDPLSSLPGSGRELTWTVVLPSNGSVDVDATGPTFWFGGTVTDPASLFGQAFVELQFYPNSIVTNCNPNGSFLPKFALNAYTVCSPVWSVTTTGTPGNFHEPAAFNAMLTTPGSTSAMVMHAGDTVKIHWFTTKAQDGYHVTVTDVTTGQAGTIVLNAKKDGPLMPAFDTQTLGNSLGWGLVHDAPNAFVWEIGHTSQFSSPASHFCLPGDPICDSYNAASWAGTSPIQIKSVTFADGSTAKHWAVVSDFGGRAEIDANCDAANYGQPFCIYPWYTVSATGFHYGVDFPGTTADFGQVNQFQQTTNCGGPFGPDSTYCATQIK